MILRLKPKVVTFWQKLGLLKTTFNNLQTHASGTPSLTFSTNVSIID